jgi:uncharacterized protein (TIGR02757 family)
MQDAELKIFLDEMVDKFNRKEFIDLDPVSIPHQFSKKEDIEISGFFTATLAWGQRKTILKNTNHLMQLMDNAPHDFVCNYSDACLPPFKSFVHRTFNNYDCIFFIKALKNIYRNHGGMESVFTDGIKDGDLDLANAIHHFRKVFFSIKHQKRVEKHIADPLKNASCKRLNMFLRWMIRKDSRGVDFGIWNISPSLLSCPLDVHSARIARSLGLLNRKQDDWKAVCELTDNLKRFDTTDPAKYDFALFGLGVNEKNS